MVSDYDIDIQNQTVGSVSQIPVTITPKADRSSGAITIYYNGSKTLPAERGIYTVTFDAAAVIGWHEAAGLPAGTLTVSQTPVASDYDIDIQNQTVGSVSQIPVTITPKADKSSGAITVFYNGSTTLPAERGIYTVTFDVAAVTCWHVATGLPAGTLTVSQTPVESDYDIGNLTQMAGNITPVTITPKADKSSGVITVFYNGSTTLPMAVGTYTVTFDVTAVTGWNASGGLSAGTLTITAATITINFGEPDIALEYQSNAGDCTFTVAGDGDYNGFQWLVDGNLQSAAAGNGSFTLYRSDAGTGPHRITVIAYKDGKPYSHELQFRFNE